MEVNTIEIDDMLRSGMPTKDVAEKSGYSQHGIYSRLKKAGARVACFTFLVDAEGRPLQSITEDEIIQSLKYRAAVISQE